MVHIPPPFSASLPPSSTISPPSTSPFSSPSLTPRPTPPLPQTQAHPSKPPTPRHALARSLLLFSSPSTFPLIHSASLKKGDVTAVSRIAGIMAAKRTADLIPLCHNIGLSGVEVDVDLVAPRAPSSNVPDTVGSAAADGGAGEGDGEIAYSHDASVEDEGAMGIPPPYTEPVGPHGGLVITASVRCFGQTGVEMEALCAASVAALTAYDMCKGVDRGLRIEATRVLLKEGGRSGVWVEGRKRS